MSRARSALTLRLSVESSLAGQVEFGMLLRCAGAWSCICVSVMDAAVCGWVRKEVVIVFK